MPLQRPSTTTPVDTLPTAVEELYGNDAYLDQRVSQITAGFGPAVTAAFGTTAGTIADGGGLTAETARAQAAEAANTALIAAKAPLDSPQLTGVPTAPTATAGALTNQIATTAFATSAVSFETSRATTAEAVLQNTLNTKANASDLLGVAQDTLTALNGKQDAFAISPANLALDGVTDDGPALNALLALGPVRLPFGKTLRTSVTINIPGGSMLEGTAFAPGNPASGSTILCDAGVSPAVRVGNQNQPYGASLRRMIVKRAGGQPTADKIGVLVDGDYNPVLADVFAYNHGQSFVLRITGFAGLGGQFTRLFTGAISDAHVVLDGWCEARFSHCRFGMNGGGDYAANTYVRVQGGISGSAAGPNGLTIQNSQLNQGTVYVHHVIEFVNLAAPVPNVDAVEFNFDNVHAEGVDQAVFYSDASWNVISRSHITGSTFNVPSAKFFALNAATTFDDFALIGNHIFASDLTLAPTNQINSLKIIGNRLPATNIAAGAGGGATTSISGNTLGGNLTVSGQWGLLNGFGNLWTAGSLINNATGRVAIADALSGGVAVVAPGAISGLTLSNDATTPASVIGIAPGSATASSGSAPITLKTALSKSITTAWAAGSGGGALDTGSIAASTWYHVFLIGNPATGAVDALVSLSATTPTMPSGYSLSRRIGAIRTDASSNVRAFKQLGASFVWGTSVTDLNSSVTTTAALIPLTVPTGVQVEALFRAVVGSASISAAAVVSSPNEADVAPTFPNISVMNATGTNGAVELRTRTDTSGRVRVRGTTTAAFGIQTFGWVDPR